MSENEDSNPNAQRKKSKKRFRRKGGYICAFDDCLKSYGTSTHLRRHEETHIGHFPCSEENCGKEFKTKSTLKKHINTVHLKKTPKKYKCSYCDEEFNKHNWLTRHVSKHTGINPYLCPNEGCGKRFLVPSKLKRHMKIHNGYECTKGNCDKILPTWTLLNKHIASSHPKNHQCHYCEKVFSTASNMKAHMELHKLDREVFLCPKPDCSKFYTKKETLNHHIKSFHEQRPFVCTQEHCHKGFKSEAAMIAHCSRNHKCKRKKKKKSNAKPSFAAQLAGLVPTKKKLPAVIEHTENNMEKTSKDYSSGFEKNKNELESANAEVIFSEQPSQDVSSLIDDENTSKEEECIMENGIQMVLNMIEKRNGFGNESTVR